MTAKIKLNAASGGGSVSLQAPTSTTNDANLEFKLPVADGTSGQVIKTDGSGNLSFAADAGGKILQVVQHPFTTGDFSTTSNSYVDVTGFSQAITPTAASSKILVMLSCDVQSSPTGTYNGHLGMSINRSVNGGSYTAIAAQSSGNYIQQTYTMYHNNSLNINLLDSPSYSLGNAITYKMQLKSADTSVTSKVRISVEGVTNGAAKLILIEVAA